MKKRILSTFLALLCLFLLCGCGQTAPRETDPPVTTTAPPPEPLEVVKGWLEETFSFHLSWMYMNLAYYGNSQETDMLYATDGSFRMITQRKNWNHLNGSESEEVAEFYYQYEGDDLVCYMRINEPQFSRVVMSDADLKAMDRDRPFLIGAPTIVPDFLQDLELTETADGATFTYRLPLEEVLDSDTILGVLLQNAFNQSGKQYDPADKLSIGCTLETDPETYRPRSLTFDFTEVKPQILSSGALSGEYALKTDFVTLSYRFDYDLEDTVPVREEVSPELASVLVQQQYLKTAEKCDYGAKLDKLSHEEQVFYIVRTLDTEVVNGGFRDFLYHAEKKVFTGAVDSLRELGAEKTATLCQSAFDAFDEKLPTSLSGRMKYLDKLGLDRYYELVLEFDNAFFHNEENLTELCYAYMTAHPAAFS